MKTRKLGNSGIDAGVVAFGAWAIGGWTWGGNEESDSIDAVHAFLDSGGNLVDTAPVYGFGHSEEVVAKAIKGRRDEVVLATKCGMRWDLNDEQMKRAVKKMSTTKKTYDTGEPSDESFDVFIYNGADGIKEECERSLKRLGVDHIDLYQTHWQNDGSPIDERMGALLELKQAGKIRAIGVSNASTEEVDAYAKHGPIDSVQEKYSMLDRDAEAEKLPKAADDGRAFLAYSPLSQGLLTGKITVDRDYDEGDQRRDKKRFKPDNVKKVQAMLDPMRPIAEEHGASLAQLTMAWTLAQRGCSHVLCGARNAQQAKDNAKAADIELSDEERSTITKAVDGYDGI